jgi:hypothetical protein
LIAASELPTPTCNGQIEVDGGETIEVDFLWPQQR